MLLGQILWECMPEWRCRDGGYRCGTHRPWCEVGGDMIFTAKVIITIVSDMSCVHYEIDDNDDHVS